jgi:glycosyltransferase 2 family protein
MSDNKKCKHIFMALRFAFVLAAIVYTVYWTCQNQRWKVFLEINPWLFIAAILVFIISQVIIGFRWWLLLRTQAVHIDLKAAVRLNLLGVFYSNFMPSSVGGDLLRAWYVTKHTHRKFVAVLSVFVDRIIGMFSIACMAVGGWMIFMRKQTLSLGLHDLPSIAKYKNILLAFAAAVFLIAAIILKNPQNRKILFSATQKIKAHIKHAIETSFDAFWMYCKSPLAILWAFLLTIILQSAVVVSMYLIADKMGMNVSIKYFFVFFPVSWVLGAVPLTPGGAVLVEGSLVLLFTQFAHSSIEMAFAISMCQRFIWLLSSLPGIIIHLSGTHLPKDFDQHQLEIS